MCALAERPAYWTPYGQNNFGQRYRTLVEYFSVFLQKWRAMVEVRFLRSCVDPNAPQEPLDADAQAEVDGGDGGGEVPLRTPPGRGGRRRQRRRLSSQRVPSRGLSPPLSG